MKNINVHDTVFAPNGAFLSPKEPESNILLKKRWGSTVYCPKPDERRPGSMYPRAIVLEHNGEKNGTILATFECYTNDEPVFPIYESTDDARSWSLKSEVRDTQLGYGCRFQPHLFEMPCDSGALKEGTILCAGNIIPNTFTSTALHLYKSEDAGETWSFVSEIISGGMAHVDDREAGSRPVWEPFIITDPEGKLYIYYSDERYANSLKYNQLLAHKYSVDGGLTWSEEKFDVAFADGIQRPGMPIVAALPGGKYVYVYENVNVEKIPVLFRISEDLDDWGEPGFPGNPVIAKDGRYLTGTPYVTWIPQGGEEGTILVTGRGFGQIFANSHGGRGFWEPMETLIPIDNSFGFTGYSQCLVPLHGGRQILSLCPVEISEKLAMIRAAVADVYVRA